MSNDCGQCQSYISYVEQQLSSYLEFGQFRRVQCDAQNNGLECLALYHSPTCQLLIQRTDGADYCALGTFDAPFLTDQILDVDGSQGWFNLVYLLEYRANKKIMTQRVIEQFWDGSLDYHQWLSQLLAGQFEHLLAMVAPGAPATWLADYIQFMQRQRYYGG
ncbi:hypothetical protein ACP8Y2_12120 [Herpetosiphon llansteffanensis]